MAQQLAEKHANFLLPDIVEVKLIVQAQALSSGTYGDSGNDRDLSLGVHGDDSEPEYTPAGTTSWLRAGSIESPTHRRRLGGHPTVQRFFYSGPVLLFPVLDGLVVSF